MRQWPEHWTLNRDNEYLAVNSGGYLLTPLKSCTCGNERINKVIITFLVIIIHEYEESLHINCNIADCFSERSR